MNTEYTSFEPPTAPTTPADGKLFHWWPPGFLGEDELEPLFSASSEEDAENKAESAVSEDEQAQLAQRLAHAFRVIDQQAKQINDLTDEIGQLEEARRQEQEEVQKVRQWYRRAAQGVLAGVGLVAALTFHREVSQVGWNVFRQITDILRIAPEDAMGFLTFLAAVLLFWQLAKWTWRAAAEEFSGKGGDSHDLGNR